jgi:hypothetical protein
MKTYNVSLLVESSSLSLDELSLKLGRPHSLGSHAKGEAHRGGSAWPKTVWRFDSGVPDKAPVQEHLENLKAQFPPGELRALVPAECGVYIDIVIFFDTVNVSLSIPRPGMEIVDSYDAALEITAYLVEKEKS